MTIKDDDRLLRMADVSEMVGLGKSSIYRKINDGDFPLPVQVAPNAVRWRLSEIRTWMAALQPAASAQRVGAQ